MIRGLAAALAIAAAALITIGVATARTNAIATLRGTVGPGFTITMTQNGKKVTRLQPGTYRIVVADRSSAHNFELEKEGGAVKREITSVSFTGTKTVTVRLSNGTWRFYCDPHRDFMRGSFRVGVGAVTPAAATTTTVDDHGGRDG